MSLFLIASFILGTIIGSFLNVVALRYNTGKTVKGRSKCFSCGKTLHSYELIPVVSYLFLRGKCSVCKSKISFQYPLVEFLTGLLFLGIFWKFSDFLLTNPGHFLVGVSVYAVIFSILMVIIVYDIQHTIIPDALVYAFIALSFLIRVYFLVISNFDRGEWWNLAAGFIFFFFFFLLWFVSKGTWMGFGDAKLVLGIGLLLGLSDGTSALFLAFWIGSIVGLFIIGLQKLTKAGKTRLFPFAKQLTIKSEIPFAPFLILGLWLVFFFELHVLDFVTTFL